MPRLDVPFKQSPIPRERGVISELRLYWKKFCNNLYLSFKKYGHEVRLIEVPLWQLTEELVARISKKSDLIYIPHKMQLNWHLDDRIRYYMQMVVPNIFSIDSKGWCASSSCWPIHPEAWQESSEMPNIFSELELRVKSNISKFKQPVMTDYNLPKKYILFPCQIPHDETIRYHSDVSVEDSLRALLASLQIYSDYFIIIKGHPANTQAMARLKNIYLDAKNKYNESLSAKILWIDDISVHQLLANCAAVFTVNSGVGLEALFHYKKVFTFGNADYAKASTKIIFGGSIDNAALAIAKELKELDLTPEDVSYKLNINKFVNSWYYSHFDCEKTECFDREVDFNLS